MTSTLLVVRLAARSPIFGILLVGGLVFVGSASSAQSQEPFVQVTFLDVGQGDAVVIRSPEGRTAMIDGGRGSPLRFLQQMSVDSIDLLVATHPHADHIGGLDDVLTARPVRRFLDNGRPHTTETYAHLMVTLDRLEEVTYLQATPRTITLGSATLEVLRLPDAVTEHNYRSVGLVLRFGDFSAFFSGDSERYELDYWTGLGVVPEVTLLKAPHHGSINGFTRGFLAAARPEVVVVSVGADNNYGHPRPEAMTAYESVATRVLRTDLEGHVTVLGYQDGSWEIVTGATSPDVGTRDGSTQLGTPGSAEVGRDVESPEGNPGFGAPTDLAVTVVADAPGSDHQNLNGEYAIVHNSSAGNVAIGSWRLCDLRSRCFRFPPGARILARGQVRVYTGYGMSDGVSFFMNNERAVWNNDGDEATLYDDRGEIVLRFVY